MRTRLLASLILAAAASLPLAAHHSFSAAYFEQESLSIEGEIVSFEYKNPHAWVHVRVAGPDGRPVRYSAEWVSVRRLRRLDISEDTLRAGDRVQITGSPGRNPGERLLHLKEIRRASDGWTWSARRQR